MDCERNVMCDAILFWRLNYRHKVGSNRWNGRPEMSKRKIALLCTELQIWKFFSGSHVSFFCLTAGILFLTIDCLSAHLILCQLWLRLTFLYLSMNRILFFLYFICPCVRVNPPIQSLSVHAVCNCAYFNTHFADRYIS